MENLKVVEMFQTNQGEGLLIGTPSVFLRLGRCNLACLGCDTVFDKWKDVPASDVADQLLSWPEKHLVITGGEPTLWQKEVSHLVALLKMKKSSFHVTIETNGAVPITNLYLIDEISLWSFSPKVGTLGRGQHFKWDVIYSNLCKITTKKKQLKYVLDPFIKDDLDTIQMFHEGLDRAKGCYVNDDQVFFQPYDRGTVINQLERSEKFELATYAADLAELRKVVDARFKSRFRVLPQLHKIMRSDIQLPRDERFNAIPAR